MWVPLYPRVGRSGCPVVRAPIVTNAPTKSCLGCGRSIPIGRESRCEACGGGRGRPSAAARGYGQEWRGLRKRAIAQHLATKGATCPGWGRPAHEVDPKTLTGDHIVPQKAGGKPSIANVAVLCHSCNSAKRDRSQPPGGRRRYAHAGIVVIE